MRESRDDKASHTIGFTQGLSARPLTCLGDRSLGRAQVISPGLGRLHALFDALDTIPHSAPGCEIRAHWAGSSDIGIGGNQAHANPTEKLMKNIPELFSFNFAATLRNSTPW